MVFPSELHASLCHVIRRTFPSHPISYPAPPSCCCCCCTLSHSHLRPTSGVSATISNCTRLPNTTCIITYFFIHISLSLYSSLPTLTYTSRAWDFCYSHQQSQPPRRNLLWRIAIFLASSSTHLHHMSSDTAPHIQSSHVHASQHLIIPHYPSHSFHRRLRISLQAAVHRKKKTKVEECAIVCATFAKEDECQLE